MAETLAAVGRIDAARLRFVRAVELEPRSTRTRLDHAGFLAQHGDISAARQEYVIAADLMPDNPELLFQIGTLDLQLGDTQAAATRFHTLVRLGKRSEALVVLEETVRLEPDYNEARTNRDDLRRLLGDTRGSP